MHAAGLKSSSIVWEFLEQRLAPLQGHSQPMWLYAGLADPMRLDATPLGGTTMAKVFETLTKQPPPVLLAGCVRPLYRWSAEERDAIVARMPAFDRWGPFAEGSESRADNPYALDFTEEGDGGLGGSEPPSPVKGEGSVTGRRRTMAVSSSDDEGEQSDAGPHASPSQDAEIVAGDTGEVQEHPLGASLADREADNVPVEVLSMARPREAPSRKPLPKRRWVFKGR